MSEKMKLSNLTLGELLADAAKKYPDLPAAEEDGRVYSYSELNGLCTSFAAYLYQRGVRRGTHVGIWCTDSMGALVAFFALQRLGSIAVMLNTSLGRDEILSLLDSSDTDYILYGDGYKEIDFRQICGELAAAEPKRKYIYIGKDSDILSAESNDAADYEIGRMQLSVKSTDTATILFTSGTSGKPKGVMSSHFSWVNNAFALARGIAATASDKFCVALPMFHCFGLNANILASVAAGACVCFPRDRRSKTLMELISNSRCTVFHGVPALYDAMLSKPDFNDYDYSSLRIGLIGGDIYTPEKFKSIRDGFKFNLMPSLGMTETAGCITIANIDDDIAVMSETIGHFIDNTEGRIVDMETGAPLPAGKIGEIRVRGYNVMQGYYKAPEQTEKAFDSDGWLRTGDTAFMDERGNLHFSGRVKDIIIRGGENISPGEIEFVISGGGFADSVKAIGIPDDHYGEKVCVCIIPKKGYILKAEEVISYSKKHLAYFKVPEYVLLFDDFPRTPRGKVDTAKLKKLAVERINKL